MHSQAQFRKPTGYRGKALALLIERRPFNRGSLDWQYRTDAAWKYLQMAMGKPSMAWTNTPPRVTVA